MTASRKIYHITHIRNLHNIMCEKALWSDAKRLEKGLDCEIVGMSEIKRRRLQELKVGCCPETKVGEYVPFYFCPRSIMLYILHKGNHPDIDYHEGQCPILHLQADLITVTQWAQSNQVRWAFSDRNAGEYIANFYNDLSDLDKINWAAVEETDFRDIVVKEGKQAEFLVHESFPWELVEKIGVCNDNIRDKVMEEFGDSAWPNVTVEHDWYY